MPRFRDFVSILVDCNDQFGLGSTLLCCSDCNEFLQQLSRDWGQTRLLISAEDVSASNVLTPRSGQRVLGGERPRQQSREDCKTQGQKTGCFALRDERSKYTGSTAQTFTQHFKGEVWRHWEISFWILSGERIIRFLLFHSPNSAHSTGRTGL